MREEKENKCIALRESDPAIFGEKFALALKGVKAPDIFKTYQDGNFIAIITWSEETDVAETVKDEFNLEGIRYVCDQCPHLEKDDDKRKKWHPCKYAEFGSSRVDSEACELFYKMVKQGRVSI